jgi:hypothetical protein
MADLILRRREHDDFATLGRLYSREGAAEQFLCWTLENRPPRKPGAKEPGHSRIPAGTHDLGLRAEGGFHNRYHNRWPGWHEAMVEILLTGWQYVLFHIGNYHTDTQGCVLIGDDHGKHSDGSLAVWRSRMAYERVYPVLLAAAKGGGVLIIEDES